MQALFILNDPPYGSERTYNGLRIAIASAKQEGVEVKIYFIGDGVSCVKKGQKVAQGFYNIEIMINNVLRSNGEIGVCGTCMDARGIADDDIIIGVKRTPLDGLIKWTLWADKVFTF